MAGALFILAWAAALVLFPLQKAVIAGYLPLCVGVLLATSVSASRAIATLALQGQQTTAFLVTASAAGLAFRVGACLYFPLPPANDHEMFVSLASSLAAGTGYATEAGPTAFFPPGMPFVLAVVFRVTGASFLAPKLIGLFIGVALIPLSYWFAKQTVSEAVARWTAVLVATSPTLIFYSVTVGYEQLLAGIILVWAWLTYSLVARSQGGKWRLVAIGLLCGVGTLIKPVCLFLPVLSFIAWIGQVRPVRAVAHTAIISALMLSVVLPWTMRNWRVLGHPVLVSTNGGFVLYSANNDNSLGIATPVRPLPGEVDEVSRDRLRRQAAVKWILSNPWPFAKLAVVKTVYTWGTSSSIMSFVSADRMPPWQENLCKAALNVGWGALFVWCAMAAWRTRIWSHVPLAPALLFVLYLFAVHLVYEALSRHHITVIPILCVTAAAYLADRRS